MLGEEFTFVAQADPGASSVCKVIRFAVRFCHRLRGADHAVAYFVVTYFSHSTHFLLLSARCIFHSLPCHLYLCQCYILYCVCQEYSFITFWAFKFWPLADVSYHGKLVTVSSEATIDQIVEELIQSHTEHLQYMNSQVSSSGQPAVCSICTYWV